MLVQSSLNNDLVHGSRLVAVARHGSHCEGQHLRTQSSAVRMVSISQKKARTPQGSDCMLQGCGACRMCKNAGQDMAQGWWRLAAATQGTSAPAQGPCGAPRRRAGRAGGTHAATPAREAPGSAAHNMV